MAVLTEAFTQRRSGDPLQILTDCHRRIEHFLQVLRLVVIPTHEKDVTPEQAWALKWSLQYFREAAPRHTADEEQSLFPRLRVSAALEATEVSEMLDALEADHVRMEQLQHQIDAAGVQWLRSGHATRFQRTQMYVWLEELRDLYQRHINLEETEIVPLAARTLNAGQIRSITNEIRTRRLYVS
jgi:hemerythrin-like domain-containing protein